MPLEKMVINSLFYTLLGAGYLLLVMVMVNPRIWGYQDYPDRIKEKVSPQTRKERALAGLISVPWVLFMLAYPVMATALLERELDGDLPFAVAFLNIFFMVFIFFLVDVVVLDWLIISKITPKFVIIDGTTAADYKDFSHHYKSHAIAAIPLTGFCALLAVLVVIL
ncbi:MAG: hypothetical protein ACFFGZ_01055 [Candidatus Thorarchaeota archaeon]